MYIYIYSYIYIYVYRCIHIYTYVCVYIYCDWGVESPLNASTITSRTRGIAAECPAVLPHRGVLGGASFSPSL